MCALDVSCIIIVVVHVFDCMTLCDLALKRVTLVARPGSKTPPTPHCVVRISESQALNSRSMFTRRLQGGINPPAAPPRGL